MRGVGGRCRSGLDRSWAYGKCARRPRKFGSKSSVRRRGGCRPSLRRWRRCWSRRPTHRRSRRRPPAAGSVVPHRRVDLTWEVLAPDYQRLVGVLEAEAGGSGLRARELAVQLGLEAARAKAEGLRSKGKRLVERGGRPMSGPACSRRGGPPGDDSAPVAGEAVSREHGHRPQDDGFAAFGPSLVVPGKAPRAHQPAQRPLHHPPAWKHHEPAHVVGAIDDLKGEPPWTSPCPIHPFERPSPMVRREGRRPDSGVTWTSGSVRRGGS